MDAPRRSSAASAKELFMSSRGRQRWRPSLGFGLYLNTGMQPPLTRDVKIW